MCCMAVIVHAGKHQRCDPESELALILCWVTRSVLPILILGVNPGPTSQEQCQQLVASRAGGGAGSPKFTSARGSKISQHWIGRDNKLVREFKGK